MVIAASQIHEYHSVYFPFNLYHVEWDDRIGPNAHSCIESFPISRDIDVVPQIFDMGTSIFGKINCVEKFSRQMVFAPLANIGKTAYIVCDFRRDFTARGHNLLYIVAVIGDFTYDDYPVLRRPLSEMLSALKVSKDVPADPYYQQMADGLCKKRQNQLKYHWQSMD